MGTAQGGKEQGFTLAELLVAIAIGSIVLVSTMAIARYLIVSSAQSAERTSARLEVQYVNEWLSEDVVQARRIYFGNTTGTGFPLEIEWPGAGGNTTVTYWFDDVDEATGLARLMRTHETGGQGNTTTLVAKNLDSTVTRSYRKTVVDSETRQNVPVEVLVVDAVATVGLGNASSHYEVYPRASVVWAT